MATTSEIAAYGSNLYHTGLNKRNEQPVTELLLNKKVAISAKAGLTNYQSKLSEHKLSEQTIRAQTIRAQTIRALSENLNLEKKIYSWNTFSIVKPLLNCYL